jgi:hypothetical protein
MRLFAITRPGLITIAALVAILWALVLGAAHTERETSRLYHQAKRIVTPCPARSTPV